MFKKYLELLKKGLSEEDAVMIVKGQNPDASEDAHSEALAEAKTLMNEINAEKAKALEAKLTQKAVATEEKEESGDEESGAKKSELVTKKEFVDALKSIKMNTQESQIDPEDVELRMGKLLQLQYANHTKKISDAEFAEKAKGLVATPEQQCNDGLISKKELKGLQQKTLSEDTTGTTSYGNTIVADLETEIAKRSFMKHRVLEQISVKSAGYLTQIDSLGRVDATNLGSHNATQSEVTPTFTKQTINYEKASVNIGLDKSSMYDPYAQRDLGAICLERSRDARIRLLVPQIISGKAGEAGINSNSTNDEFDGIFFQAGAVKDIVSGSTDQALTTKDIEEAIDQNISEEFRNNPNTCVVVDSATFTGLKQERDNENRYQDRVKMTMKSVGGQMVNVPSIYGKEIISTDLMKKTLQDRTSSLGGSNLPLFAGDLAMLYYAERANRFAFFDQTLAQTDKILFQMIFEYKWIIPTGHTTAFVAFTNAIATT